MRSAAAAVLFLASAALAGCADAPRIWFENQTEDTVNVSIDGDRLIILAPNSGQFLPYTTAAWAWPRRIEAATREGRLIWSQHRDAGDLAQSGWIIYIRP